MRSLSIAIALLAAVSAQAAEPVSALDACRSLPKGQQKLVVRMAARGGTPVPEVWTVVTHDVRAAKGLKELTINSGTTVASRQTSDLIDKVAAGDVIGIDKIKVDSDALAELAASYADANEMKPASFDFDLRQEGEEAVPLWTVSALDESGAELGSLVVAAGTGAVVSHTSFKNVPTPADLTEEVANTPAPAAAAPTKTASTTKKSSGTTKSRSSGESSGGASRGFRKVGGKLQKFFTGKDTISR